jgi:lipopolysaccharide transport system ATP-binding protein
LVTGAPGFVDRLLVQAERRRDHHRGAGRCAADLAAGIDLASTGIENIYLRGYILEMSLREIAAKLDDIVEFSELGDFLAPPMRTCSAGMFVRVVSTAARKDILLIDESIGAGDAAFRKKAQQRIERLFDSTPIVILASHSEELISEFCNHRLLMEHGVLKSES